MALTQGSIITISEINAEFDTKIDTAGAGLSKDGTSLALASLHSASGMAGPSANATPAYGATFTVPQINYDTYGRVTGHSNRTVKIPDAPSGGTATAISNVVCFHNKTLYGGGSISEGRYDYTLTLPSGGTWRAYYYYGIDSGDYVDYSRTVTQVAGGKTISGYSTLRGIAIRVA